MNLRGILLSVAAAALLLAGCEGGGDTDAKPVICFMTDAIGEQHRITEAMAADFEAEHGVEVELIMGPNDATERLSEYQKFLGAGTGDIDVYQVDVIWPGILAQHFVDLSGVINASEHFDAMIENNTINGKLVAAPFYADAGLLYYRTDLLEKYGYENPPQTWGELEEMAAKIQAGERDGGNDAFAGYVFQGASYEGLTCNALEWQVSEGGGRILQDDGTVVVNTEGLRRALERVRGWVGGISPKGVLTYKEEETHTIFLQGNAAFMRNWPYVWSMANGEGSPVNGLVAVTTLPKGSERSAATLGGWTLAVSKYSDNVDLAKQFVAYLSTREAQRRRALEGSYHATRPDVYGDSAITDKIPYYDEMKSVFENAVARPADIAGRRYNEISSTYFRAVHDVLSGGEAEPALAAAEEKIQQVMSR